MKPNTADVILDKVIKRKEGVSKLIDMQYKNVKPFNQTPLPKEDQIWSIDNLTEQEHAQLYQEFGADALAYLTVLRNKLTRGK